MRHFLPPAHSSLQDMEGRAAPSLAAAHLPSSGGSAQLTDEDSKAVITRLASIEEKLDSRRQ